MKLDLLFILLSLFLVNLSLVRRGTAGSARFDVTLDALDPGSSYENFHEAGAGTNPVFAVGFQIDIQQLNGSSVSFGGPFATFCTELQEPIGVATYTHSFAELGKIARGRAGEAGTASSAIPTGGIGAIAAARVRKLFDDRYQSSTLSSWGNAEETQAFQLALWEVTHDSDLSLSNTGGAIYVGAQSDAGRTNALVLAQTWLDDLSGITTGNYTSTVWDVWALESLGTPEGNQDILFATAIGSGDSSTIGAAVPEPASALLVMLGGMVLMLRHRNRRH